MLPKISIDYSRQLKDSWYRTSDVPKDSKVYEFRITMAFNQPQPYRNVNVYSTATEFTFDITLIKRPTRVNTFYFGDFGAPALTVSEKMELEDFLLQNLEQAEKNNDIYDFDFLESLRADQDMEEQLILGE